MNILKYYWNDVIIVLAVNYFLIDYKTTLLFFTIFALLSESTPDYILYFLLLLMLLATIIRIVALPILYGYMEKHSKEAILLKFIHNLKHSWKWKIGILLITMLSPIIFDFNYPERFPFNIICLTGFTSYVILYVWWWIKDKFLRDK